MQMSNVVLFTQTGRIGWQCQAKGIFLMLSDSVISFGLKFGNTNFYAMDSQNISKKQNTSKL
jgi:hypothetical protein